MFSGKHATKRSPILTPPLRVPGESQNDAFYKRVMETAGFWIFAAVFAVVFALMQWLQFLLHRMLNPALCSASAVAVVALAFFRVRAHIPELRAMYQGIQGERLVGQMLEEFRTRGYSVLHDVPGDRGNVDHVLVGPKGVFVVETKTVSKPRGRKSIEYDGKQVKVNGFVTGEPIEQVLAEVGHIKRLVKADAGKHPPTRGVVPLSRLVRRTPAQGRQGLGAEPEEPGLVH